MAAPVVVLGIAFLVTGCSAAYDSYMSQACDGLRAMVDAYTSLDRGALLDAMQETGALAPAAEEAAGDQQLREEITAVDAAGTVISLAAFEPPEVNDGDLVWRGRELSTRDQAQVDAGLQVCEQY